MARSMHWLVFLSILSPEQLVHGSQHITISLVPRDYIDPRAEDTFVCGMDIDVDKERLIGELNAQYIFEYLDNTADPSSEYKTTIYDVALFSPSGSFERMLDQPKLSVNGLHSLFLLPAKLQCNRKSFADAKNEKNGYYPVFVNADGNIEGAVKTFESEAGKLKELYGGQFPKICGSTMMMKTELAENRKKTLTMLFNFWLNDNQTRQFDPSPCKICLSCEESKKAFAKSGMFDLLSNPWFDKESEEVDEDDAFLKTYAFREKSSKKSIGFLKTTFPQQKAADKEDIVLYHGPIVFEKNENSTEVYIQVKKDDKTESDEIFMLNFPDTNDVQCNKRVKRAGEEKIDTLLVLIFGAGHFAEFDNNEKGPFRKRNDKGDVIEGQNPQTKQNYHTCVDHSITERTIYKSTYSVKLNIPIRAIVSLDGQHSFSNKPLPRSKENGRFVTDLRYGVRPRSWNGATLKVGKDKKIKWFPDITSEIPKIPFGSHEDYTHPAKYDSNRYKYTKGHLISSEIFRTLFMKERLAMHSDILFDFASYMTNIFPQNDYSNEDNNGKLPEIGDKGIVGNANWGRFESLEMQAAKLCLQSNKGKNKFHIAKGTIPNGPGSPAATKFGEMVSDRRIKTWNMLNYRWESSACPKQDMYVGNTNVNIPRYLYMAYCCDAKNWIEKQKNTPNRYVIFEHQIIEEQPEGEAAKELIQSVHDNPTDLLKELDRLWRVEHPEGSELSEPILFKQVAASETCGGGFDIDPIRNRQRRNSI